MTRQRKTTCWEVETTAGFQLITAISGYRAWLRSERMGYEVIAVRLCPHMMATIHDEVTAPQPGR